MSLPPPPPLKALLMLAKGTVTSTGVLLVDMRKTALEFWPRNLAQDCDESEYESRVPEERQRVVCVERVHIEGLCRQSDEGAPMVMVMGMVMAMAMAMVMVEVAVCVLVMAVVVVPVAHLGDPPTAGSPRAGRCW